MESSQKQSAAAIAFKWNIPAHIQKSFCYICAPRRNIFSHVSSA
ncbi:unnamed protein product [Rhodiola kirilowii]